MTTPDRGFPVTEFEVRTKEMQSTMRDRKVDALILTTEPNVRYFSGFFTQFWESPTRPWFLVIPANGKPIAVIPEIGIGGMQQTWIEDIHTWPSPQPEDDGIFLLVSVISKLPKKHGRIGMTLGIESIIRMPVNNFELLKLGLNHFEFVDLSMEMHEQRMVKSELEIAKTRHICGVASDTFEAFASYSSEGMTETEIVRNMKIDLLKRGADTVSYVVAGSGQGGYDSIIMGPTNRQLTRGDLMIIDTGSTFDGYFCDFDRNWAFGYADDETRRAYEVVYNATEAGFNAARPGATTSDLWKAMNDVMVAGGSLGNEVGRLGHGLGIQLTERPSNTATDGTILKPGMVMTLEPGMTFQPGKQMVHEENIVITEDGAQWLTRRASPELPIV
ncbi:MAG: M24 family metallopeptidase [Gammaproteobacteria bacterium]|nr:M24 family metallopeptidase [Gammaproteobacteria bacterium]